MMVAFEIRELHDFEELRDLAELFAVVWGRAGEPPIGSDVLKALAQSGNYVSGAYRDGRLVGGLVGWFAGTPPDELHLHSHILGVLPGSETHGLGFELKQHQRRWCMARGLRVIEWTTDPLVRRNGYFNLTKLGADAPAYLINVYGEMRDGINAGEESDRLLIRWHLDSERAARAATGNAVEPELASLRGEVVLAVDASGGPRASQRRDARVLLCQVPEDIVAVRRVDPAMARAWRVALREAMAGALAAGYELSGATRDGWYVLDSADQ
jgi:predicted GNAT superfamily acetyltransferase